MRSLVLEICRNQSRNWASGGLKWACSLAVLAASVGAMASEPTSPVTSETLAEAQKLRIDARVSAEQGDFLNAVSELREAARLSGDRETEDRANSALQNLEAGGGNMFANFQPIIQLLQDQTAPPAKWFDLDQEGGRMTQFAQGVFVGGPLMLSQLALTADDSGLMQAAQLARTSNQNADVNVDSQMRLVSLTRLEKQVQKLIEAGKEIPADMLNLAGISEVQYLFLFPETGDVVIGGPAGQWTQNENRTVSVTTGRPTLQLDDLVTLSRTFSADGRRFFMCSIDPKQGQVKALHDYVSANRSKLNAKTAQKWTAQLEQTLGLQDVIVQGLPVDSRVASVIVDADYRMKEIGIGKREGVSGMKSYFDVLSRAERRGSGSMDALRWWMTVGYDAIRVAPNGQAFELTGRTVKCLSENQMVKADGQREATGKADRANREFAELFTKHLPELAKQDAAFADLQNIFDLALVSALMNTNHAAERTTGWSATTFAADGDYAPATVDVPDELMTAAACKVYSGGDVVIQVAGGVRGDLTSIVR
ncbi:MAG: DUF1598 domain-containing protein, partial [Planctomycetaceae bacterium]|nr:DUF1598 domain-containing protein [Planctomycetaceae bacterium]